MVLSCGVWAILVVLWFLGLRFVVWVWFPVGFDFVGGWYNIASCWVWLAVCQDAVVWLVLLFSIFGC